MIRNRNYGYITPYLANHWHLPWSTFGNSPAEWFEAFGPFAEWIADNDN